MIFKRCSGCKKQKSIDNFSKCRSKKDGLHNECKLCAKKSNDKYREKNRERDLFQKRLYYKKHKDDYINRYTIKTFGISLSEKREMLSRQNGVCAICTTNNPGKRDWVIDHDHRSNKNRGILCRMCNLLLGHAKDDITILKNAVSYLEKYK